MLELLRIVETLDGDAHAVFMEIVGRLAAARHAKGRRGCNHNCSRLSAPSLLFSDFNSDIHALDAYQDKTSLTPF